MTYYLAIDIGASSGRHIIGWVENGKLGLKEIYRFENSLITVNGHLCWDSAKLYKDIVAGLKECVKCNMIPKSIAIDTWGVDFALFDKARKQVGDTVGYRDHRTDDIFGDMDKVLSKEERYQITGIADQFYNTANQLLAIKKFTPDEMKQAEYMLMTPDYYNFLLTGVMKQEYTMATTTQLVNVKNKDWDYDLIEKYGLPKDIFQKIDLPGTKVGTLSKEVQKECGFNCDVVMAPSHDTASAILALPSIEDDNLFISSGTWSLMGIESKDFCTAKEMMLNDFTNEGGYGGNYTILKNIMGLWMIQSVRKEIAPELSFADIVKLAEKEKISSFVDCNDARFLSPASMCEAIGDYCRETKQEVPQSIGELARVVYVSLAKCYAQTKQQMEENTGKKYSKIFIIGGGSQAEFLNKLTAQYADVMVFAGPTEATAIGNIATQMIADGVFRDVVDARTCIMKSFEIKEIRRN